MKTLQLSHDLSFEELYTLDGLKKLDSYFIEKLLKVSPDLCNRMLDARVENNKLYKSDESKLILDLAPHLESFITELFNIYSAVENYKTQDKKLDIVYKCNRTFIQKHVMNLDREMSEIITNIKSIKISLMMHGIILPSEADDILEAEIDMATTFLEIYEQSNSADTEWAEYHKEILTQVENYSLWAIKSFEGQRFHMQGALFRVPMKIDYSNLIPDLKRLSNIQQQNIIVTKNGELLVWILFAASFKIPTIFDRLSPNTQYQIKILNSKQRGIAKVVYAFTIMNYPVAYIYQYSDYLHRKNFTFKTLNHPRKVNKNNVISEQHSYLSLPSEHLRVRNSFALNDLQTTELQASHEANYCLYCHNRDKDSCSHGMKHTNGYQENPLKVKLYGCPLEQKISEMHLLRTNRNIIGALATIMIDNPMVAATGHRICNDCMKGCIFQKQTPVNTPSVESRILKDVLYLPFGFEIYSLLSKWNPLNFQNPSPKAVNNYKVLVVGLGPAGFTMIHYLLNNGVNVVGIDGLKIEPLQSKFTGIANDFSKCTFEPIANIETLFERLENRPPKGFGGVMEYGITVRWDKNMLDIIRLLLLRRRHFRIYDGVRFGSNLTFDDCKDFDHIALCAGAGSPNIPDIKNVLTKGVRMSSDFLMSLQAGGAYRTKTILPLQIRMPIVVIGAGLTAVDSATEAIQYYLVQIKKFFNQHKILGNKFISSLSKEDQEIAREFIAHARQLKKHPKKVNQLIEKWGGVTILYRKTLQESPAYRINHEELAKAFEEGIKFVENAVPQEILDDEFGHCKEVICTINGRKTSIPAKSIIIATGTQPNTFLGREDQKLLSSSKVTYYGDADPKYNGSVVKAMASAKNGYKKILDKLKSSGVNTVDIFQKFDEKLTCYVQKVERLTPNVVEVVVKAPLVASHFKPGQFFKLQKYESNTKNIKGYKFVMEGIALTGAAVEGDCISLVVLELGLSSRLCNLLQPNEKVVLMGPTGMPTGIPHNKNVLLIGGGLGNAVLISIGKKMREQGCRVIYFAGYKKLTDRFKVKEIEEAADTVIWCCDEGLFEVSRPSDIAFHGNIIEAIKSYPKDAQIQISEIKKMVVIGSDRMMAAVAEMRKSGALSCPGIASVNSPMNCMMKEICAQCIQKHRVGKKDIYIYSCVSQDQNIDTIDFKYLENRLSQNSLLEKSADNLFLKLNTKEKH